MTSLLAGLLTPKPRKSSDSQPIFATKSIIPRDTPADEWIFTQRILIAGLLVTIAVGVLIGRWWYLQIIHHKHFSTLADTNRIRLKPIAPARGLIFDRNGKLMVDNLLSFRVEITPEKVENLDNTIAALQTYLTITEADIRRFHRLLSRSPKYQSLPLRLRLDDEELARLAVNLYQFPGVSIQADLTRHYPHGTHAAHLLGYVGRIDERDMQRPDAAQYRASTHIGKKGVELSYESVLHGQMGYEKVETNAEGRVLRVLERRPPIAGKHVYLTIDSDLQRVAEETLGDYNGAIVALDPRNGELLAMASQPSFDPNLFVNGIDHKNFQKLNSDRSRPLFNRTLQGLYPPGSTIKPMVALAGLEQGVTRLNRTVHCPGYYSLPGDSHRFRCWNRRGHGSVNASKAIIESCDVYFYDLAVNLGVKRLHDYMVQFSFGRPTGVDLIGEKSGIWPSEEWKLRTLKKPWYPGETVIAGIGQGYVLSTPLQLAQATAVVAMRGKAFFPHILRATQTPGSRELELNTPRPFPPIAVKDRRNWEQVIIAMMQVVHSRRGTARKVGVGMRYTMAGKTGTAQVFSLRQDARYDARRLPKHLHDHALFVAFAPLDDPRIAIAVIAENGGGGSATAAPMARRVMDAYLNRKLNEETTKKVGNTEYAQ